jgi:hypothetical protein
MNVLRFFPAAATILFSAMPNQSQAREILVLSYQEMLEKSDFVVIATPESKTIDTNEQAFLPGIFFQDRYGKESKVKSIGVETIFVVSTVLKGDATVKRFMLHHYREAQIMPVVDGAILVSFDPSDISKRSSYLLFLVREPDGRFAPVGGQTDPGLKAISRLPFEPRK